MLILQVLVLMCLIKLRAGLSTLKRLEEGVYSGYLHQICPFWLLFPDFLIEKKDAPCPFFCAESSQRSSQYTSRSHFSRSPPSPECCWKMLRGNRIPGVFLGTKFHLKVVL